MFSSAVRLLKRKVGLYINVKWFQMAICGLLQTTKSKGRLFYQ